MRRALESVLLVAALLYGFAVLFTVVMVDVPVLMHPKPERDAHLKITAVDVLRQTGLFAACLALGRRLYLGLKRDEASRDRTAS